MWDYIDSCHKESERRATYPEHSTAYVENVANTTVNSASVIPQEKYNGGEEDCQENPYDKNEGNGRIEQNASNF